MSHVADIDMIIDNDLSIIEQTLAEDFNGRAVLMHGQTTHKWYGRFLNDWQDERAAVNRRDAATFGKCDHAIRIVDNHNAYEIGLVKRADGLGYDAVYDAWCGGHGLHALFGDNLDNFKDQYGARVAMRQLIAEGHDVYKTVNAAGNVEVVATSY